MCLKYLGKNTFENSGTSQTTKLLFPLLQETTSLVERSSTMSYVLLKKGGTEFKGGGIGNGFEFTYGAGSRTGSIATSASKNYGLSL